jgi:hypothetical protein
MGSSILRRKLNLDVANGQIGLLFRIGISRSAAESISQANAWASKPDGGSNRELRQGALNGTLELDCIGELCRLPEPSNVIQENPAKVQQTPAATYRCR